MVCKLIASIFMASQGNIITQNMLGTLSKHIFFVCASPTDAHPYKVYLT